ncbi:hypothetical protein FQR65_LT03887 [Abscondita terminalis]|nr:hypothetical protein FQR65_LT03887 [Abscondita terminalis]
MGDDTTDLSDNGNLTNEEGGGKRDNDVAPIFTFLSNNWVVAFRNEGVRRQNYKEEKEILHALDDVLFSVGDNIIELKNLNLTRSPDFRITSLSVNFPMSTLSISMNLGNLTIEGDYEVNNTTLQQFLPLTHPGKIEVTLHNVVAVGKIGLFIKEDSFVAEHYDINYTPFYVTVIVSHKEEKSESRTENIINKEKIDETIAITFWSELKATITNLLHAQLQTVIVEESVSELLAESDVELRKGRIVAESARLLKTPRLDVLFKGRHPSQQQGSLEANEGYIQDLSTLSRTNDVSFYENEQEVIIYGSLNLREFKALLLDKTMDFGTISSETIYGGRSYKHLQSAIAIDGKHVNVVLNPSSDYQTDEEHVDEDELQMDV